MSHSAEIPFSELEEEVAEDSKSRAFDLWVVMGRYGRRAPSWLISAITHLLLFIVFGLITLSTNQRPDVVAISTVAQEEIVEMVEPAQFTAEPLEMNDLTSTTLEVQDVGVSDVTASFAPGDPVPTSPVDVEGSVSQIGALFGESGRGMASAIDGAGAAEFFGVKAGGRKFVFVVDSSMSMRGGKFEAAKKELSYAVRKLSADQFFYVIFFDHDAARMTFTPGGEAETRAARATPKNIQKLERWMKTVELEFRTDPLEAVEFAMDLLPDAMYLLTDGKFTDRGQTEQYLQTNNVLDDVIDGRRPKVVVHTIGFYQRDGQATLKEIADAYNGAYRFVAPPRNWRKSRALRNVQQAMKRRNK